MAIHELMRRDTHGHFPPKMHHIARSNGLGFGIWAVDPEGTSQPYYYY
jgi:hypothetical protein